MRRAVHRPSLRVALSPDDDRARSRMVRRTYGWCHGAAVQVLAMDVKPRRLVDIPSLDGLRAVSIAIVFVAHAGYEIVPGGLGVTIFFVISGFLITTLLRLEVESKDTVSLRDFYLRRVFRILPLFYGVLILGLIGMQIGLGDGKV